MLTLGIYAIPNPSENLSSEVHDHNLVVMSDGRISEMIESERITRKKHDNELHLLLEDLIDEGLLHLPDKFRVVFVDSFAGRRIHTPKGLISLEADDVKEMPVALQPASGHIAGCEVQTFVCSHELAHIGTHLAFTGGFQENSLLVHIDGGASKSNCSVWLYRDGKIQHIYHSWELHPQAMNFSGNPFSSAILGMPESDNLSIAGKLMGYSSYGAANSELKEWLRAHNWFWSSDGSHTRFFEDAARDFHWHFDRFDTNDPFIKDIAACIQEDIEERVEDFIFSFKNKIGAKHLYYSGGVALNIRINSRLENSGRFESIHIPPCCNDTGLAIGAAALLEFLECGRVEKHGPFLNSLGLEAYSYDPQFKISDLATRIAHGHVIGICTGNAEVGPRALGHRSLIASPCSKEVRNRVSLTMKEREWYRPVAPMVLRSEAEKLFENASSSALSRYMLGDYKVRPEARDLLPGIVHVNGMARAQVVEEGDRELALIADLLEELRGAHGIPCVINTSFNRKGEPIVHTRNDAMTSARAMKLDALILDNVLLLN
jgi:carbamoyltransferase